EMMANAQKSQQLMIEYMGIVMKGKNNDRSRELGEKFLKLNSKNPQMLNQLAWTILTNPQVKDRDKELALKTAKAAVDACEGKDPAIVDTYARAQYDSGKKADAIKTEKKAIELLDEDTKLPKQQKSQWQKEFKKALATYESGKPTKPESPNGAAGDD